MFIMKFTYINGNFNADCKYKHVYVTVDGSILTFHPPMKFDAGSYLCRSKTDHSNTAEGILIYLGMQTPLLSKHICTKRFSAYCINFYVYEN